MLEKPSYLFVGAGRLARHLCAYFDLLEISYRRWSRQDKISFARATSGCDSIVLCIPDDAIESFIHQEAPALNHKPAWVHCSGNLSTPLAQSAHPLMTFGQNLMTLKEYRSIPFITEAGRADFKTIFPELDNPTYEVKAELKNFYHAWCVLAGNFSTMLWQSFFDTCEKRFDIPRTAAFPYLEKVTQQLQHDTNPLSGPLARGDKNTIKEHLDSLEGEPFKDVYAAFVKTFTALESKEPSHAKH